MVWCVLNHILPFDSNHSKCFIVLALMSGRGVLWNFEPVEANVK